MSRVFAEDLAERADCQGRMRLLGVVTEPAAIERILRGRRTAARAPPHPAQLELASALPDVGSDGVGARRYFATESGVVVLHVDAPASTR